MKCFELKQKWNANLSVTINHIGKASRIMEQTDLQTNQAMLQWHKLVAAASFTRNDNIKRSTDSLQTDNAGSLTRRLIIGTI